jgi:predicted  nucleic acid-binding Zn-ribbon protein
MRVSQLTHHLMKLLTAEQYNMTTPLRQFILKRGNTAVSSTYTGPAGEITYDTGLNAVRIHDGITPGGNLMPSGTLISVFQSNITALESNVSVLFANAATQAGFIATLQSNVATLQGLASSSGEDPPGLPSEGALWYDPVSGRLYVYYDGFWIDASPETVYTLPTATANTLGGVKIGGNLTIVDGVLSATSNLGNLRINNQTISGTQANADIILSPDGTGNVAVPKLKIPVGSIIQGTAPISVTIANLTLNTLLDYSTSSSDNLVIGDYGLPNGVSGSGTGWAVYEFTTNPAPVLEIGDHIAGVGVPFLSNVLHIGTGPNANVIVTDQTITSAPPLNGTTIYTTRDVVNAGLNITTVGNTDISLIPGPGGHIVTTTDIIPFVNDVYNLGTPAKRFKQVWLGGGTIFILDETLGTDQAIGARDGNIYIDGGSGITVGKFTFYGNTIAINDQDEEIQFGAIGATGNVNFNRPVRIQDETGRIAFASDRTGRTEFYPPRIPAGDIGALSIIGTADGSYQPVINPGGMIHVTGYDGDSTRITSDTFGAGTLPIFVGRAARGTASAPTETQAGDLLVRYAGLGYAQANYFATGATLPSALEFRATENYSSTAFGSNAVIYTYQQGTVTRKASLTIDAQNITLPSGSGVTFGDSSRQTTAWLGDTSLNAVNANITAANVNIATLFANAAVQSADIATLFANAGTQQTTINTLLANAAAQQSNLSALTANAATQQTQINAITANAVTAVTAGFGMSVNRVNGTVGVDALGVTTVAGTANQILVNGGTAGANAAITLTLPQSINTNSTVTFSNLTITGNLTVQGNIITAESSALDSKILYLANTATAGSQLDGGGIILGNVNAAFKRSILYDFNADAWDTNGAGIATQFLYGTDATFTGNVFANGRAHFGGQYAGIDYPFAQIQVDSNQNSPSQVLNVNYNPGTTAYSMFVALNDLGSNSPEYSAAMGMVSSNFNDPLVTALGPNDSFLNAGGGNLAIQAFTVGKVIKFVTGGPSASNLRATIDDLGITALGNVSATYFVGSGKYLTDLYSNANVAAYLTTDSNITAIWANITSIDSAWQANAGTQQTEINALGANITAANAAIVTANSAVVSYVNTLNTAMTANITAVNLQISNTSVAVFANAASQQLEINALRANITAANVNISALQSNTGVLANNINILFANMAAQEDSITALRANITAANSAIVTANTGMKNYVDTVTSNWTANAASQQTEINSLRANITAANSAIVTANSAVVSYVNTLNTAMTANVTAANSAIVTANTGMKSYVDAQFSSGVTSLTGGNNIVLSGSTGGVTIQRVDGLQSIITGNTASSYTLTTTNQYFGTTRSATGTGTVTLPLGSTVPVGRQYIIKDEGGQSGYSLRRITVAASGSDTIDGSASRGITSNYGSITVLWTGTRWSVI